VIELMNPIAKVREKRGFTRTELALAVGISHSRLSALEAGRERTIGTKLAKGLTALGFDPCQLREIVPEEEIKGT
jgi:transcriptional regulator with XRE-family HTH domain